MKYYLGLDSSTQSLSAIIIDLASRDVVYERTLPFDDLVDYSTQNGVLRDEDPKVVHAPPMVWVAALDQLLAAMKDDGAPLGELAAISGSGQQHGSVYLNDRFPAALVGLDPAASLAEQLEPCLARATSPIWMDSSTRVECDEIRAALGGLQATSEATGSNAIERFTGPQIRKFAKTEPDAYEQTAHIALVSSFLASVVAGRVSPIDSGDGAGMNLMDIAKRDWHPAALDATAPELARRLPPIASSSTVVGPVHAYFVSKYGIHPEAKAVVWSGDNPNSVVGLGLVTPGMVAISLGTSDTYFGTMADCHTDPHGEGHVFGNPSGGYMTLNCITNGSLAREKIANQYDLDWDSFSAALRATPPGNDGKLLLPVFEPETVPRVPEPCVRRRELDEDDVAGNCRAVVEAQMMSMRNHATWMGERPTRIFATGGASRNREILQIIADVQGCTVDVSEVANGAALGAALRAAHADQGDSASWTDIVAGFTDPIPGATVHPNPKAVAVYDQFASVYEAFERQCID